MRGCLRTCTLLSAYMLSFCFSPHRAWHIQHRGLWESQTTNSSVSMMVYIHGPLGHHCVACLHSAPGANVHVLLGEGLLSGPESLWVSGVLAFPRKVDAIISRESGKGGAREVLSPG